jgi:hypothetical protein
MTTAANSTPTQITGPLPRELRAGALLIEQLQSAGWLDQAATRFFIARRPGYVALDGMLFLLYFISAGPVLGGLRGFYEMHREWADALGAIGGRARLMSSAALSRLLGSADPKELAKAGRWWLLHASGALGLLQHPSVLTRDSRGGAWHVFDFDPSRQAFRQRALPEGADLPPGSRRLEKLAAPGHRGRKRGEVVCNEGLLIHNGAGVWLDATVQRGNGDARAQFASALLAVVETCDALGCVPSQALLRTDGQFGSVPALSAAEAAGVAYLTRLARYGLLDTPEVRARLNEARWVRVPDSGSGPVRHAADLGEVALPAGEATRREDGSSYAPVVVRVVVSRYTPAEPASKDGVGFAVGEEIFELFGSLRLSQDQWPPEAVVAAYYGRISQENRFAQLDREFGAEMVWARSLGGQLLALLMVLFVWNTRIVQGVKESPPLPPSGAQSPRPEDVPPELPHLSLPPQPDSPGAPPLPPSTSSLSPEAEADDSGSLLAALAAAGLASAAARHAGWTWRGTDTVLHSVDGKDHRLTRVEDRDDAIYLRFRSHVAVVPRTQISVTLTGPAARHVVKAWNSRPKTRTGGASHAPAAQGAGRARWIRAIANDLLPPDFIPEWPSFLPAAARAKAAATLAGFCVSVDIRLPAMAASGEQHPLVAASPHHRRRRRLTHAERRARMAAPAGTVATLTAGRRPRGPTIRHLP